MPPSSTSSPRRPTPRFGSVRRRGEGSSSRPTPIRSRRTPGTNAVSVWYHYTHGALLDGPDSGTEMFSAAEAAQISTFVNNDCWAQWADLIAAGAVATDYYSPAFTSSVAKAAALGFPCASGDTTCSTWIARYAADRPHLSTGPMPFLIWYGGQDQTIPPGWMACVIQRLGPPTADYPGGDNVNLTFCLDPPMPTRGSFGCTRRTSPIGSARRCSVRPSRPRASTTRRTSS
jgi:hypothetical protein